MGLNILYNLAEFSLRLIAFPLGSDKPVSALMRFFQAFLVFSHIFVILSLLCYMSLEHQSFITTMEGITYTVIHFGSMINLMYYYTNEKEVQSLYRKIKSIAKYQPDCQLVRKEANIKKEITNIRIFSYGFEIATIVACGNLLFYRVYDYFVHNKRELLFDVWLPYNYTISPIYELTVFVQATALFDVGTAHYISNVFYMTLFCLTALSIRFLRYELGELFFVTLLQEGVPKKTVVKVMKTFDDYDQLLKAENDGEEDEDNIILKGVGEADQTRMEQDDTVDHIICSKRFYNVYEKNLIKMIERHELYLQMAKEVNGFYWPILLFQLTMNLFYLVFIPMSAIINRSSGLLTVMITYTTTSTYQLAIITVVAQMLKDESTKFQDGIYNCPWYMLDSKRMKIFLMMITRCVKPMYVNAGKYLNITLETFVSTINVVLSFCAVLINFINR